MAKTKTDPRITKRKVTMTNWVVTVDGDGNPVTGKIEAVDYVPDADTADGSPNFLDQYVTDARTRWDHVTVSDEYDAGPGGYEGQTAVPDGLDHPSAGTTFAATEG